MIAAEVEKGVISVAWSFVKAHARASLAIFGALVLVLLRTRKRSDLVSNVQTELQSQAAAHVVHQTAIDAGVDIAHEKVRQEYDLKLRSLTADKQAQAEKLRADPAALAAFVVKASQ